MLSLAPLGGVVPVRVIDDGLVVAVEGEADGNDLRQRLEEEKEPKLSVVELADAAADPEAVVVELAHASVAVPAVPAAIRLFQLASLAESLRRQIYFLFCAKITGKVKHLRQVKKVTVLGFEPRFPEPQSGVLTTRRHRPCSAIYSFSSL